MAYRLDPWSVPSALLKVLFSYLIYFVVWILFATNLREVFRIVLFGETGKLRLRHGFGTFTVNRNMVLLWAYLLTKGILVYEKAGKIYVSFNGGTVCTPSIDRISLLIEPYEKVYRIFDFSRKKVLDVGGYLGETAYLFHKWGASCVVVYEPDDVLSKHAELTLRLNGVNGRLHKAFVGEPCSAKSVDWQTVLNEGFDVAKVDCEGCEGFLLYVPDEVLRRVPYWVIECHDYETYRRLEEKFTKAGFITSFRAYYWSGVHCIISDHNKPSRDVLRAAPLIILSASHSFL